MSIERRYNRVVQVDRVTDDESGDTQEYGLHIAGVRCMIQALDENYSEDIEGNFGKDFLMICAAIDIKEGDRIIEDDDEYRVVGLESYEMGGSPHMELRIRTFNP